ncbi:putative transmembrane protein [Ralstonia solanacearum CMR15]|nr:putative transmembrane protein [Ralstonia solanacearum CMR15]
MLLTSINQVANVVIFVGSLWAVLTHQVPTRTGGALVLALVNFAALGNIVIPGECHSAPEVALNVAVAVGALWAFWRLELRRRFSKRGRA